MTDPHATRVVFTAVDEEDAGPGTLPPPDLTAIGEDSPSTAPTPLEPSVGTGRRRPPRARRGSAAPPPPPPLAVEGFDEEAAPGAAPPPEPGAIAEEDGTQPYYATPAGRWSPPPGAARPAEAPRVPPASLPPPSESQGEAATPAPPAEGRGHTAPPPAASRPASKRKPTPSGKVPSNAGGGGGGGGGGAQQKAKKKTRRAVGGSATRIGPPVADKLASFSRAIHATMQQLAVAEGLTISKGAMATLNDMVVDIRDRVAAEAAALARVRKGSTLQARDVQTAVRLVFPGELAKHAVSEGSKAVVKVLVHGRGG